MDTTTSTGSSVWARVRPRPDLAAIVRSSRLSRKEAWLQWLLEPFDVPVRTLGNSRLLRKRLPCKLERRDDRNIPMMSTYMHVAAAALRVVSAVEVNISMHNPGPRHSRKGGQKSVVDWPGRRGWVEDRISCPIWTWRVVAVPLLIEIFVRLLWSQSLACPFAPERPLAAALVFPPRRLLPDMAFSGALVCSFDAVVCWMVKWALRMGLL